MKFPKHRANVFLVERMSADPAVLPVVCGVFPTYDGASDFAGACKQDFIDRGFQDSGYSFQVYMSTYYDV